MPGPFSSRRLDEPADLRVIAALGAVGAGRSSVQLPTMSATFRDELRTQLVAVAPRLIAEGVRSEAAPRRTASTGRRAVAAATPAARTSTRTRPMTVLVAGAAVVVLGLGGATWLARGALPGDPLYGLKRTAEGVDVSLSGSDLSRGHSLLVAAQTRVDEVSELIGKPQSMAFGPGTSAAGGLSATTVKLVVSTLQTADSDTQRGVATIGNDYLATGSLAGLRLVDTWAGGDDGQGGQIGRIQSLVDRIPDGPAHQSAADARRNIQAGYDRVKALLDQHDPTCTNRPAADDFGPQPCAAISVPTTPTGPSSSAPTTGSTGSTGSAPGGGTGGTGSGTPAPGTSAAPTPTPSATPTPSGAAPGATSIVPPAVAVDSCGVQVSLPVAGVSLGTCPPGR